MTTQALKAMIVTEQGSHGFLATVTDQVSYTELLDSVNGLSLWKVAKGKIVTKAIGGYVAGSGTFRIRNTQSNLVKFVWLGTMIKGIGGSMDAWEPCDPPIVIEDNDIMEATCNVAST